MSTATSTATDGVDGDTSTSEVGPFRALWWAGERLVSTPQLLVLVGLFGAFSAVSLRAGTDSGIGWVTLPVELYLTAVIFGYVGFEYGDFRELRDMLFYAVFGAVRLGVLTVVFGVALAVSMLFLLPGGYLGIFVFLLLFVLLFVNVLLLMPAVCIDEGVISAIEKAWSLADEARWTVFGLLVLTGVPIWVIQASLEDPSLVVLAAGGLGIGFFSCVFNLALGRIYVGQRSKLAN